MKKLITFVAVGSLFGCGDFETVGPPESVATVHAALAEAINPAGIASTVHLSGSIDRTNPFFQALGTNPRTCETCHSPQQGWTINSLSSAISFVTTLGLGPLFNLVDEGSRPDANISTLQARINTFVPTTVNRALTRFTRSPPAVPGTEFTVVAVSDPSGFSTPTSFLSFRRPTPTANETKVASILWTGVPPVDVLTQVRGTLPGGARLHEQRDPNNPVPPELAVAAGDFMFGVIFAQLVDFRAGLLNAGGAKGGPEHLKNQEFYVGINDPNGGDPMGRPFNPRVFNIFDAWAPSAAATAGVDVEAAAKSGASSSFIVSAARGAIYRGQEIFNSVGRCSGCHSVPNVGGSSFPRFFNIGTAEPPNCDTSILPMLTVRNNATGEEKQTCDLGRAGATGLWADIGRFRAPPLRGLAARAPYFHDGQAKDIAAVVGHYNARLNLNLTTGQKRDLEAFLRAL
jgi:cytochrome c peroxidase